MRWIGALLLLAGCRQILGFESPITPTDAEPDVLVIPDAAVCTELSKTCVAGVVLRDCTAIGELPVDTTCNWGCVAEGEGDDDPHCGRLDPAANVLATADLDDTPGLADVTISDPTTTIDTDTGEISGIRPGGLGAVNGIEYKQLNNTGVFRLNNLTITARLAVTGQRALAIASLGDVAISAIVDLRGGCAGNNAGPGGSSGGPAGSNGQGPGAGGRGEGAGPQNVGGGGGGSHGELGGAGGDSFNGAIGGNAGPVNGMPEIPTLVGGSGGGGGARGSGGGQGGGGGGALQLVSNTKIEVVAGGINAGGCGGRRGQVADAAGGGGGAGGTILLEAPLISITEGGLAVNGGGGGSGGTDADGEPGLLQLQPSSGGLGVDDGSGGAGGAAGMAAIPGVNTTHAGGGGGGVGRIRLHTRSGTATIGAGGFTSPMLGEASATQSVPAIQ